jgi:hypothetical protein
VTAIQQASLAPVAPSYSIREDDACGVIRMSVEGFFDLTTLREHFAENRRVVELWRSRGRRIRVFIEASQLRPHSPAGQLIVQSATASIYTQDDRVAVNVGSSLVRMQMRRALEEGRVIDFFATEADALAWLRT